jgi:universal stress protein E
MKRFKNILLISDFNPGDKSAVERAVALASQNNASLTVASFIGDLPEYLQEVFTSKKADKLQNYAIKQREELMEEKIKAYTGADLKISCQVIKGCCFVEIIRKVLRDKHDLVIMPAEGAGRFKFHIFGSNTMHIMRKCPCPVWVVKPERKKKHHRILAAVQLDESVENISSLNIKIMDLASSLAKSYQCELHVIYAWKIYGLSLLEGVPRNEIRALERQTQREHREKMKAFLDRYDFNNINMRVHIKKGKANLVIPDFVQKHHIDLIVMGTVSHAGLAGFFMGHTAEEVLQRVNCSVLAVKPDEFVSPVKEEN